MFEWKPDALSRRRHSPETCYVAGQKVAHTLFDGDGWDAYFMGEYVDTLATLEAAKAVAETAFKQWLDRAGLPSGDYQDGYRAGLEAAARLVDETSEAYAGSRKYLAPRIDGSLTGLGYAEAIRNLAGVSSPTSTPHTPVSLFELYPSFLDLEEAINNPPSVYVHTDEPTEVRAYRHWIYPKWQSVTRDVHAMLAAAPKPGEAP